MRTRHAGRDEADGLGDRSECAGHVYHGDLEDGKENPHRDPEQGKDPVRRGGYGDTKRGREEEDVDDNGPSTQPMAVSYTHLRAHETDSYLVCRLLLEK